MRRSATNLLRQPSRRPVKTRARSPEASPRGSQLAKGTSVLAGGGTDGSEVAHAMAAGADKPLPCVPPFPHFSEHDVEPDGSNLDDENTLAEDERAADELFRSECSGDMYDMYSEDSEAGGAYNYGEADSFGRLPFEADYGLDDEGGYSDSAADALEEEDMEKGERLGSS